MYCIYHTRWYTHSMYLYNCNILISWSRFESWRMDWQTVGKIGVVYWWSFKAFHESDHTVIFDKPWKVWDRKQFLQYIIIHNWSFGVTSPDFTNNLDRWIKSCCSFQGHVDDLAPLPCAKFRGFMWDYQQKSPQFIGSSLVQLFEIDQFSYPLAKVYKSTWQ